MLFLLLLLLLLLLRLIKDNELDEWNRMRVDALKEQKSHHPFVLFKDLKSKKKNVERN